MAGLQTTRLVAQTSRCRKQASAKLWSGSKGLTMFRNGSLLALLALMALAPMLPRSTTAQPAWAQVGTLNCRLAPSVGLIIVSQQRMGCEFIPSPPGPPQRYNGVMTTVGVDIGVLAGGALAWAVYSSTTGPAFGGLSGAYVGASGEATLGLGLGENVLFGGSARSIALQPFSVEGTAGLNVQLGVSNLELMVVP